MKQIRKCHLKVLSEKVKTTQVVMSD